jgi:lysophospholipase L1-like esterase
MTRNLYGLGDSFTYGNGAQNPLDGFLYIIGRALGTPTPTVYSGGSVFVVLTYALTGLGGVPVFAPEPGSLITYLNGFSDLRLNGTDPSYLTYYRAGLHHIVDRITAQKQTLVLGTCAGSRDWQAPVNEDANKGSDAGALVYSGICKEVGAYWAAKGRDVRVADTNKAYNPQNTDAGIHPNELGHQQIAQCMLPCFNPMRRKR